MQLGVVPDPGRNAAAFLEYDSTTLGPDVNDAPLIASEEANHVRQRRPDFRRCGLFEMWLTQSDVFMSSSFELARPVVVCSCKQFPYCF